MNERDEEFEAPIELDEQGERAKAEPAAQAAPVIVIDSNVFRLPHSMVAVPSARRRVRHELARLTVPKTVLDDVEMVVSELVCNSVRHALPIAGGVFLLGWRMTEDEVVIRVTDGGGGRGVEPRLQIVDRVARVRGVSEHAGGLRSVWAAIALPTSIRLPTTTGLATRPTGYRAGAR